MFYGDNLFEDNISLLKSNKNIDEWNYPLLIGKLLLWCWLHCGAWPRWFHKCHMRYIIEGKGSFSCETILSEYLPALYRLICSLKEGTYNEAEIIDWIDLRCLDVSKFYNLKLCI